MTHAATFLLGNCRAGAFLVEPSVTSSGRCRGPESEWVCQVRAMAAAWASGEQITVEELLKQYPELSTEKAVRLVYEEVCLRREAGQQVVTAEFSFRRFGGRSRAARRVKFPPANRS